MSIQFKRRHGAKVFIGFYSDLGLETNNVIPNKMHMAVGAHHDG